MHQQREATDRQSIKSEQDRLRGLLPNINVIFDKMPDFTGLYSRESTHYPATNGTGELKGKGGVSVYRRKKEKYPLALKPPKNLDASVTV